MARGRVPMSDFRRHLRQLRDQLHFVPWNVDGWKTGLCEVPPVGQVIALA